MDEWSNFVCRAELHVRRWRQRRRGYRKIAESLLEDNEEKVLEKTVCIKSNSEAESVILPL